MYGTCSTGATPRLDARTPTADPTHGTTRVCVIVPQHDDVQEGEVGVAHLGDDGRRGVRGEVRDAAADVGGGGSDVVDAPRENDDARGIVAVSSHISKAKKARKVKPECSASAQPGSINGCILEGAFNRSGSMHFPLSAVQLGPVRTQHSLSTVQYYTV